MRKNRRGRKRIVKQIITFTCFSIFSATAWYNVNSKELAYDIMAKNDQVITIEEINSVDNQAVQVDEQTVEVSNEETKVEVTEVKTKVEEQAKTVEKKESNQQQSRAARREDNIEENLELTSRGKDLSSKNAQIVELAKKYIGGRYVWGANGPNAFDCSGLTQYVYAKNGIGLNRTAAEQAKQGVKVSKNELEAGDLVFFKKINSVGAGVSHVGIYIGNGKFIHASTPAKGIRVDNLSDDYYTTRFHSARRVIG